MKIYGKWEKTKEDGVHFPKLCVRPQVLTCAQKGAGPSQTPLSMGSSFMVLKTRRETVGQGSIRTVNTGTNVAKTAARAKTENVSPGIKQIFQHKRQQATGPA